MAALEDFVRFWRAMDDLMERVDPAWWGAVVTDTRCPRIWDANYARLDVEGAAPTASQVEGSLIPELTRSGATTMHVVIFYPEELRDLIAELSTRGHTLSWDVVMGRDTSSRVAETAATAATEELDPDDETWSRVADSLEHFGIHEAEVVDQLMLIEREAMAAHKRWFGVREDGEIVALGALVLLEGVGYVDNVVTFPQGRGRRYAGAITTRIAEEAALEGASSVFLLAEPDGPVPMYERVGFTEIARIAGTRGPLP